jgi:hypothetical protein
LYDAGNPSLPYVFVGLTEYINIMKNTDPLLNSWINPTIVSGLLPAYNIYVCNDPLYQRARIYTNNLANIPTIINLFLDYILNIDSIVIGDVLKLKLFLESNLDYDIFNSPAFFLLLFLSSLTIFKLPGLGLSARKLIENGYQVQVFNDTTDPDELYNLADSSRLHKYRKLCNLLLKKLEINVRYQNLENIFISLPSDIDITSYYEDIKNFVLSDMPIVYNYTLLESNNYNKTNGGD